jgi:anti-anti-sigma factor
MKPVFLLDSRARPHPDLRCVRATTDNPQFEVCRADQERHGTLDQAARTVFRVSGEVDLLTSPRLAAAIASALQGGRPDVVVDLARVEFIDAAGIHVLENAAGEARGAGGELVLRSPSRAVRRMLGVLDLDRALPVER